MFLGPYRFGRGAAAAPPEAEPGSPAQAPASGPETSDQNVADGPRVALALGGGAARGLAHIGVLRVLERHGIRPSVIAGTSIGAAVGGLWAAGSLDAFEAWARRLTRRSMLSLIDPALGAAGLMNGRRLLDRLRAEVGSVTIEDLPIAFSAIATELGTGHEIWLTRGNLADAIHASYSLPGIFTPVKVGGRWLMDGALVNPIPVSSARALGGRIVIAVNLNAEVFGRGTVIQDHGGPIVSTAEALAKKKEGIARMWRPDRILRGGFLPGPVDGPKAISAVMIDAFNVMQDRIARARLAGDPPDVNVAPKLGKIGLFDFHRADEAIAAGAEATERVMEDIVTAIEALR
ncbi:patatin-like phospholipase family protein [Aquabacter spiritensis]|uniref:NTE family protein n=1 Tax=Aquabacter spiritensis TaxID=933073 RepID=A0A4R3M4N8_9HYPH|nr:patatin-like phospholipase family protein [Aquabacter spiritensis]TCT07816.1 NTE family protein [Aquabacter spiritensis]